MDDSDYVRYAIHSDEAVGYFAIDPVKGVIKTTAVLDHESFESVLLNVKAYSETNKYYGAHTQVSALHTLITLVLTAKCYMYYYYTSLVKHVILCAVLA